MDDKLVGLGLTGLLISGCVDEVGKVEGYDTETEAAEKNETSQTSQSWEIEEILRSNVDMIAAVREEESLISSLSNLKISETRENTIYVALLFDYEHEKSLDELQCGFGEMEVSITSEYNQIGRIQYYESCIYPDDCFLEHRFEVNGNSFIFERSNESVVLNYPYFILIGNDGPLEPEEFDVTFRIKFADNTEDLCLFEISPGVFSTEIERTEAISLYK